ncbi:hypothetical protein FPL03_24025 (plasmid) [Xanthomonas citri pv. glycines]|uniref:Uncharacterized protein n=1 Tax=Xanthomonas citri pv. vignicola TaxID=473426 RepID=A0AB33CW58_XANCI|nr:hypothetical protein XcvCFBP7111P_25750 [Xanthomonas citri pv. vignicola]PWH22058.1 hypothetical protein CDO09_18305 [Xanthomonas perforans]QDS14190.1 hypothetical protein FPL03_24025 [Xanthomonas citri pv. glycines]
MPIQNLSILLAACIASTALAVPPSGGNWTTIAGYHPGMGKEAARKVGLANWGIRRSEKAFQVCNRRGQLFPECTVARDRCRPCAF